MSASIGVSIKQADGLDAKDLNGKSDPYCLIGVVDASGKWLGKPSRTATKKATLNPVWLLTERSSFHGKVTSGAAALKIQVWDEDKIGKDEFMGEVAIPINELKEDQALHLGHSTVEEMPLMARSSKDKVKGTIQFAYSYLTDATERKFVEKAAREAEEARQTLEKAEADRKAAEAAAQRARDERVDELIRDAATVDSDLESVKRAAKLVATNGTKAINDKEALKSVLTQLGVWESVRLFAFWANDRIVGESNSTVDDGLRKAIENDKDVLNSEMERAWSLFDHDANGSIEFKELLVGIGMISKADDAARANFFFDVFDVDKSGSLSVDEASQLITLQWRQSVGAFCAVVQEGLIREMAAHGQDIRKLVEELRQTILDKVDGSVRMAQALFRAADKDGNGTISKDEYIDFVQNHSARREVQAVIVAQIARIGVTAVPLLEAGVKQMLAPSNKSSLYRF